MAGEGGLGRFYWWVLIQRGADDYLRTAGLGANVAETVVVTPVEVVKTWLQAELIG